MSLFLLSMLFTRFLFFSVSTRSFTSIPLHRSPSHTPLTTRRLPLTSTHLHRAYQCLRLSGSQTPCACSISFHTVVGPQHLLHLLLLSLYQPLSVCERFMLFCGLLSMFWRLPTQGLRACVSNERATYKDSKLWSCKR